MTARWRSLWFLAVLAVTACGSPMPTADATVAMIPKSTPTADRSAEPIGDPPPTDDVPDPADCAPPAEPGPGDAPPDGGGDLLDFSDYGGGRWRLCLTGPIVASIESRAWCRWSEDRLSVLEVQGNPTRLAGLDYGAWFAPATGEFQLSTTDLGSGGVVATYIPATTKPLATVTEKGMLGRVSFEVDLLGDMEAGLPPGAPPRHAGTIRWICGDPPPPA